MTSLRGPDPNAASSAESVDPSELFEQLLANFRAATTAVGNVERTYSVASRPLRLSFAGLALVSRLTPALGHLGAQSLAGAADTVLIWDSRSTRQAPPPAVRRLRDEFARGRIKGCRSDSGLSLYDAERRLGLFWVEDAETMPYYESCAPLRRIFSWIAADQAGQLVHGGAVGTAAGGVLLAGRAGSGKSTTALACLDSELLYCGDDYVLLSGEPSPYVYSLFGVAKLKADNVHRFPHLRPLAHDLPELDGQKLVIFLSDHFPEKMARGFPLRAIVTPRVSKRSEPRLVRSSAAAGLRALAPSTLAQVPDDPVAALCLMASVARKLPSYVLELGADLSAVPTLILRLLDRASTVSDEHTAGSTRDMRRAG